MCVDWATAVPFEELVHRLPCRSNNYMWAGAYLLRKADLFDWLVEDLVVELEPIPR